MNRCCNRNMLNDDESNNKCECGFDDEDNGSFTSNPMYGHAYVPNQRIDEIFNKCSGLSNGSIFPELIFPYSPGDSIVEANYLAENTIESGCNNNGM